MKAFELNSAKSVKTIRFIAPWSGRVTDDPRKCRKCRQCHSILGGRVGGDLGPFLKLGQRTIGRDSRYLKMSLLFFFHLIVRIYIVCCSVPKGNCAFVIDLFQRRWDFPRFAAVFRASHEGERCRNLSLPTIPIPNAPRQPFFGSIIYYTMYNLFSRLKMRDGPWKNIDVLSFLRALCLKQTAGVRAGRTAGTQNTAHESSRFTSFCRFVGFVERFGMLLTVVFHTPPR